MLSLRDRVKIAFNAIDPEGLIGMGCPEDEYESEVEDVVERLQGGQSPGVQLIIEVMHHWFGTVLGPDGEVSEYSRRRQAQPPSSKEMLLGERLEEIVKEWNADNERPGVC